MHVVVDNLTAVQAPIATHAGIEPPVGTPDATPNTTPVPVNSATAPLEPNPKTSKDAIRRSLRASTLDGVFATLFANATGGALLSGFFLALGANPTQIGLLASIPQLANLLQPIGAYFSEQTTSRHWYCLWVYGLSRALWVLLAAGIGYLSWLGWQPSHGAALIRLTLIILLLSHLLGALGSASWLSWMAVLVPRRLRGRYFGVRNSAANLSSLASVPLMGLLVSHWSGGVVQGYGVVLGFGILAGCTSLLFQSLMVDVNPQVQHAIAPPVSPPVSPPTEAAEAAVRPTLCLPSVWQDTNFLVFLLYLTLWTFAVNLSAPFFNLYLLDTLKLDLSLVTLYNSLSAAANLLLLLFWGKLADRIGNRPLLLSVGVLVGITPLLWLTTGVNSWSIWFGLPLLHLLSGGTWAAIDLCSNNLQIGVAPIQRQSTYFGIVAALAGISGALGTTAGGLLAQYPIAGGLLGLFVISSGLRLAALLPLVFVHEQRSQSLRQLMRMLFPQPDLTPEA
ncbi:MAG: MFS transporter [Synechococcales cyanobacterium C42_A2020_086]|jgi:Na+/melibiose symporter-like transporter|nr:MFS transporter [Synechococcales cyanobacterium M58_A2018_015]MBF2073243.1 MFS transporter [Synechococcales cyanobacterium C42_A2020_086]